MNSETKSGKKAPPSALYDIDPKSVIDKDSPIPLHHQLEVFLRQGIESGLFPPHTTLPTEQELQTHFQLSRTPIRQALAKLSAEGLIHRRRSQGTIVLPRPFEEDLRSLKTFTQEVLSKGLIPGSKLLEFHRIPADPEVRRHLKLADETEVFHIRRLRFIDGEPFGILSSRIPVFVAPNLKPEDLAESGPRQSIYHVLEQLYGVQLVRAEDTFRAVTLERKDARLLRVPPRTAVLRRSRITYDPQDRPVVLEQGLYRGIYQLKWNGRSVSAIDTCSLAEEGSLS